MSKVRHVYGLFDDATQAAAAYQEVQDRGCASQHCSAILHERRLDESTLTGPERASREGATKGAAVAGSVGVALGGLTALGGGLVGVGPLSLVVLGGGVMAAYGALLGGIAGADEPEKPLRALEEELDGGKILIAVEADDEGLRDMCAEVFERRGGRQVST